MSSDSSNFNEIRRKTNQGDPEAEDKMGLLHELIFKTHPGAAC